jgi:uncharacterized coiled-coil protein SlyX
MEILLLVAIMAVAASGVYIAATFNKRTKQNTAPLINDAVNYIINRIETTTEDRRRQLQVITDELRQDREVTAQDRSEIQSRLGQADDQISTTSSQLLAAFEEIERLGKQIDARQGDLSRDLLQLDHRVAQLGKSLAQQNARIIEIHRQARSQRTLARGSVKMDSLVLAMLEAESHMDRMGWGEPPHLYALTEKISPISADHELYAEIRDARPDALILAGQEPLPAGDPIEILANIHWPGDVVGCVLVAELTALPSGSKEDTPIDPAAAEQWASIRPDGRPARLAVGVCRNGAYTCGFRIRGEDNVQFGTERADGLVAALLATF